MVRSIAWLVCLYTAFADATDQLDADGRTYVDWNTGEDTIMVAKGTLAGQNVVIALTKNKLFPQTVRELKTRIEDDLRLVFIGGIDFVSSYQFNDRPPPGLGDCVLNPGTCKEGDWHDRRMVLDKPIRMNAKRLLTAAGAFKAQYPQGVPIVSDEANNYRIINIDALYEVDWKTTADKQDRLCIAEESNFTAPCMMAFGIGGDYMGDLNFEFWVPFASKVSAVVIKGIIQSLVW